MSIDLQIQKPLRELVYLELKHKILTGEISAQTRLMEIDLAEKMNVSRTPIREAIRELAAEGLVTIEPRRGAYVSEISIKELLNVFEVREDLEGFAAYLAAQRITEDGKLALSKLTRLHELAVEKQDRPEMVEYDEKFHNFIVKCSGNNTLISMVGQIQELSLRFRYLYYNDYTVFDNMPTEHKAVADAILDGDPERARAMSERHVRSLRDYIVNLGPDPAFRK